MPLTLIALVAALRVSRHVLRPESAPEADIAEANSRLGCER